MTGSAAPGGRRPPWEFWTLTAAALVTRCWAVATPRDVVWDERHYLYFIGAYLKGTWMMDVHPPLGRLLLALVAWLEGYGPDLISQQVAAPWVRVLPALAGAALVPLVWALVRLLGGGRPAALLAAAAVLADIALLVESRFILPDCMLLAALLGTVVAGLAAARAPGRGERIGWYLVASLAAGGALSIKWTGLAASALLLAIVVWETLRRRLTTARAATAAAVLGCIVAAVYLGSFAVQIRLLRESGREDWWMSPEFTRTLEGSVNHVHGSRMPFVAAVKEIHQVMGRMNASIGDQGGGVSSSPWYTWPISKHSITLRAQNTEAERGQEWIVMTGNPVVWWGALSGLALIVAALGLAHLGRWAGTAWAERLRKRREALGFLLFAYLLNYVPLALIPRPLYLYHYFAPLVFSLMFAAIGTEALWDWTWQRGRRAWAGACLAAFTMFGFLAPIAYGWPISKAGMDHRRAVLEAKGTP